MVLAKTLIYYAIKHNPQSIHTMERLADGLLHDMSEGALDLALWQMKASGGPPRDVFIPCSMTGCKGRVPKYGMTKCVSHMTRDQQLVVLDIVRMMELSAARSLVSAVACKK